MIVRGAPLIGATGAYGLALAMRENASDTMLDKVHAALLETRPTAINLKWALDRVRNALHNQPAVDRAARAYKVAAEICDADVATCSAIGKHCRQIIPDLYVPARGPRTTQ